ncbi:MAG: MerR family transcriptional regulator [Gammaproteobacteria bacterium]|nr:MerR family transcriptional regulator [Gammaproteobacteria bacterium]
MLIGKAATELNLSPDTLRYYEKIGLLSNINRSGAGTRSYTRKDVSKIRFIKRAQRMKFSLLEVSKLLEFRENPQKAKPQVRQLAGDKLVDIETHLLELQQLHNELQLLIGLCTDSEDDCPILQEIDHSTTDNPE